MNNFVVVLIFVICSVIWIVVIELSVGWFNFNFYDGFFELLVVLRLGEVGMMCEGESKSGCNEVSKDLV